MPRLSKTCETLTPKMQRLVPFVACFFDLPLKQVLQILNVSHHTLDPIRRSMGMKKWPFVDIVRGKYCQREEVVAMRAQMMPVADTDMQRILCRVAASAESFWANSTKRIERTRRRRPTNEDLPPTVPEPSAAQQALEPGVPEEPSVWPEGEEDEDEHAFWNEMRDLFELRERAAVTSEPCLEHGLFPQ